MFKPLEIRHRLVLVQEKVNSSGLDTLVLFTDPNISYLIGVHCELGERMAALVVPASGEPSLIVPRLEQEQLGANLSVENLLTYWEKDSKPGRNWNDLLSQTLGDAKRIGVDAKADLGVSEFLVDCQWEISTIVEDLRVIKSPAEIALMRRVAGYWTEAMNAMLAVAKAGTPLSELAAAGDRVTKKVFMSEERANWINTRTIQFFQCAPDSSSPHYLSHRLDDCLPHGPTTINAIGSMCDYYAENERTILTGDHTAEHAELFDITHRGHELALRLIDPGVPCADVDCAVQEYFIAEGVSEYMRHRIGHGFGLIDQERPYLSEGSSEIFQPGMLFSIEPGLYVNGVGGFRHSDTVLIIDDGVEVLTSGTPIDRQSLSF